MAARGVRDETGAREGSKKLYFYYSHNYLAVTTIIIYYYKSTIIYSVPAQIVRARQIESSSINESTVLL